MVFGSEMVTDNDCYARVIPPMGSEVRMLCVSVAM